MDSDLAKKIVQANIELHEKEAEYYDALHAELSGKSEQKLIHHAIDLALKSLPPGKLQALDIGAGTGNITLKLSSYGSIDTITAVDISRRMLAELSRKMQGAAKRARILMVESEVGAFFSRCAEYYNLITVSSVLHHIPDYLQMLENITKHLKQGGMAIICIEPTGEESKILKFLSRLDIFLFARFCIPPALFKLSGQFDYSLSDYHVQHGFHMKKITSFLEAQDGVSIVYRKRYNLFKLPLFRLIGKFLPRKNNFILIIRKSSSVSACR